MHLSSVVSQIEQFVGRKPPFFAFYSPSLIWSAHNGFSLDLGYDRMMINELKKVVQERENFICRGYPMVKTILLPWPQYGKTLQLAS